MKKNTYAISKVTAVIVGVLLAIAVAGAAVFVIITTYLSRPQAVELNVGYSNPAAQFVPVFIAKEKGFFEQNGLKVTLVLFRGGTPTVQALIAGDIQFAEVGASAVVRSALAGSDLVMIAGIVNTFPFHIYVTPDINTPSDLRGKVAGVTRFGSSTHQAILFALQRWGLDPNKDVTIIELGDIGAMLAALDKRQIQLTVLVPPETLKAKELGLKYFGSLTELGVDYLDMGIAASKTYLQNNGDIAKRFLKAMQQAMEFYFTDKEGSLKLLEKFLGVSDRKLLEETYNFYLTIYSRNLELKPSTIKTILDSLASDVPAAKTADPTKFIDASYLG